MCAHVPAAAQQRSSTCTVAQQHMHADRHAYACTARVYMHAQYSSTAAAAYIAVHAHAYTAAAHVHAVRMPCAPWPVRQLHMHMQLYIAIRSNAK